MGMDGQRQELAEDEQAHAAAIGNLTAKVDAAKQELARAQRETAIVRLEAEIAELTQLDSKLERALASVRAEADTLIAAVTSVGALLEAQDSERFGSNYTYALTARVREVCWHRFEELAIPSQSRRPSFSEQVERDFRRAIAQLRYMGLEQVTPGRGERLYRALAHIPGLRDVDLLPGQFIPLRDDEAASFLRDGSVELVREPEAQTAT